MSKDLPRQSLPKITHSSSLPVLDRLAQTSWRHLMVDLDGHLSSLTRVMSSISATRHLVADLRGAPQLVR
jgi:hypothetical protein